MSACRWSPAEIVSYMDAHPQRAYFSRLFRDGGCRVGMEVGVASGAFSEHFLTDNKEVGSWQWDMMEPVPTRALNRLYPPFTSDGVMASPISSTSGGWKQRGVGLNAAIRSIKYLSTDAKALEAIAGRQYDFIYLDGAHDHDNVKAELPLYWDRIAPGGVLAGHDYCYYGEANWTASIQGGSGLTRAQAKAQSTRAMLRASQAGARSMRSLPERCLGCSPIPTCGVYTEKGMNATTRAASAAKPKRPVWSQVGVVQAVQEWLVEAQPGLTIHHTREDFTPESLAASGMSYDLVLTKTRNPSWYVVKPR